MTDPHSLSAKQLLVLHACALRLLDGTQATDPAPRDADSAGASGLAGGFAARRLRFIDKYLGGMDSGIRSDLRALLELLEHYPILVGRFARFSRLGPAEQDSILHAWESSRFALLRQGLQALKSLVFLAHYQDEQSFPAIAYSGPLIPSNVRGEP